MFYHGLHGERYPSIPPGDGLRGNQKPGAGRQPLGAAPVRYSAVSPSGRHGPGACRDAAVYRPGRQRRGLQRRALRLQEAEAGAGGRGASVCRRLRLRAAATPVAEAGRGDVRGAGRGVCPGPLRRPHRQLHRRPGPHRHPAAVLRVQRKRAYPLRQRAQEPAGPDRQDSAVSAGALLSERRFRLLPGYDPGGAGLQG